MMKSLFTTASHKYGNRYYELGPRAAQSTNSMWDLGDVMFAKVERGRGASCRRQYKS
jgi:hypothetical protein